MGNSQAVADPEVIKTTNILFLNSLEESFISASMMDELLTRWEQLGKPLFMVPKDFKERIITLTADQDIKLNYLKWLTQALEIDMFEILTVFILYSRSNQNEKLLLLFRLYCYEGETTMQIDEFKFMIDKMSVSLCSTLGIKKVLLLEIVKSSES